MNKIIEEDIRSGKHKKAVTRFPPEPNGFLHLGHARAIITNYSMAKLHGGNFNLRFDDTNPVKEDISFVDAIKEDIAWLGCKWDNLYFASDYFGEMYNRALVLIKKGKAFVDDLTADEIREYRGNLTNVGKNSPYRDRSIEENLELFINMKNRVKKQFTIALIFFLICASFASVAFLMYYEPKPTCRDGIQNQGELGIDCGGPCKICPPPKEIKPLEILWTEIIQSGSMSYDLISRIKNPNSNWGIGFLDYKFVLYGKAGEILLEKNGSTYILPGYEKYIIETPVDSSAAPEKIVLELGHISWEKSQNFEKLNFPIRDKKFKAINNSSSVGEVSGIVVNSTLYDLGEININIVLFDANRRIVGVNITDMATMMSDEKRYFNAIWYWPFSKPVADFDIEIDTNLFDPQNILKRYGEGEIEEYEEYEEHPEYR